VEFLAGLCSLRWFHLEPLRACGRSLSLLPTLPAARPPDPQAFLRKFLELYAWGREHNIGVQFSGTRMLERHRFHFCGAAGRSFVVNPDGHVTSCVEVCRTNEAQAPIFAIGHYSEDERRFIIDQKQVNRLAARNTENLAGCAGCFLRWNCAGNCLARTHLETGDIFNAHTSDWCEVSRQASLYQMREALTTGRGFGTMERPTPDRTKEVMT
jgi:uncharacterized protein